MDNTIHTVNNNSQGTKSATGKKVSLTGSGSFSDRQVSQAPKTATMTVKLAAGKQQKQRKHR